MALLIFRTMGDHEHCRGLQHSACALRSGQDFLSLYKSNQIDDAGNDAGNPTPQP